MKTIKIAIKELVEFIGRSGSISNDFTSPTRAIEGTLIHQLIQGNQNENYHKEYYLTYTKEYDDFNLIVSGRADGVIIEDTTYTIDEIKSTTRDLDSIDHIDSIPTHLHQAKCYGYILSNQLDLKEIDIQLTYYQVDTKEIKYLKQTYTIENLKDHFDYFLDAYYIFAKNNINHIIKRNQSIKEMRFPYQTFRAGQKEMASAIFATIKKSDTLFINAATGLGKTISTIYPSLKALQKGYVSKILYLTAKTITRTVAEDTIKELLDLNVKIRSTTITAKDKICFLEKTNCHKDYCPYALNHYDRVNDAIVDCLNHEYLYTREIIEFYAQKHQVCPFELSLDLFLFSDISISDYNYAFDPKAALKRNEEARIDHVFLVDEAHNLVDRSREMYSATFSKHLVLKTRKLSPIKKGKLYQSIQKMNTEINHYKNLLNENEPYYIDEEAFKELIPKINTFINEARNYLKNSIKDAFYEALLELYFHCLDFIRIHDLLNESYTCFLEITQNDIVIRLYCLDASSHLKNIYSKVKSTILFSATLLPIAYFYNLLGGDNENKKLYYPSPFDNENRALLIANDVSTKYRVRSQNHHKILNYIKALTKSKIGNYLIYFPSYAYLNQIVDLLNKEELNTIDIYVQKQMMSEEEKESFLQAFYQPKDKTRLFFSVLGGIFSEGIDLKNDHLIGVLIVSVGLPQLCFERDLIKEYFNKEDLGYHYAYVYPGFNKVMQAVGRLIRTIHDQGVVILLDDRYLTKEYLSLFPIEWNNFKLTNQNTIEKDLNIFWKNKALH